jgi:hypothetical protein
MEEVIKRKRGRKKISEGGKSSQREIYCSCAAIVNGKLVFEQMKSDLSNISSNDEIVKELTKKFELKYNVTPQISNPWLIRVGAFNKSSLRDKTEEPTVDINFDEIEFSTEEPIQATYKDWKVSAQKILNEEDCYFISYKHHLTDQNKTKPQSKIVKLNSLQFS